MFGNLTVSTQKAQIVTNSAGAIDVSGSYVDGATTASVLTGNYDPEPIILAQITTATTTDILAGVTNHVRNIKELAIRNASATVANQVTVRVTDGTNSPTKVSYILQPGDSLMYDDLTGWKYWNGSTAIQVPGRFIGQQLKVSGTTFTTGPTTNTLLIAYVGGGGAGGGCTSVAAAAGGGGGGGAGSYGEKTFAVSPNTTYAIAIGAAGTGVSAANGNAGGNTTMTVGAITVTAFGGQGGDVGTASTTASAHNGGSAGPAGSNGDINQAGQSGFPSIVMVPVSVIGISGQGGSSNFGGGGLALTAVGTGNAGTGNGTGGGGALTGASTVRTGGAGTVGAIQIIEMT